MPAAAPSASAATTYASDGFQRTVSSGWGSAGSGGGWTMLNGSSDVWTNGSAGVQRLASAGAARGAALASVSVRDVDVSFSVATEKVGTGYGQYLTAVARRTSTAEYGIRVRLAAGSAHLQAVRLSGSTETKLGTEVKVAGVTLASYTRLKVRAQVSGASPTTLRARAWLATAAEPTAWQFSVQDSTSGLQGNGSVALRSQLASNATNAPVQVHFDDYLVTAPATTTTVASPPAGSYVSTTGNDANPGTYSQPWRTLQKAANSATGSVWIRGGTYPGFKLQRSGLTFSGYPGETAIVSGGPGGVPDVINIYKVTSATIQNLTVTGAINKGAGILVGSSSGVTIKGVVARYNKSYGVRTWYSTGTIIRDSDIYKNHEGIRVSYTATGTQVLNNKVHDHDAMIDPNVKDSGGGVGIAFLSTTGASTASGNQLWKNRAYSQYYGYDGGAFEIFGASDVNITGNVMWDNKQVMETGTSGPACNNNRFTRNVAYSATTVAGYNRGLLFTCMSNSTVANNVLDQMDMFAVSVVNQAGYVWGGSMDGLKIVNNVFRSTKDQLYYLDNPPATVTINNNVAYNTTGKVAYSVQKGSTYTWTTFRSWHGHESAGTYGDPKFVNPTGRDYHLQSTSPAINRGVALAGITDGYLGGAPDSGRYEKQ